MKNNGRFPDFIIVGAMKAGTTALWFNLNKHPKIIAPRPNKNNEFMGSNEIRFWHRRKNWKKGFEWYKNLFAFDKDIICGEKSPEYCTEPRALNDIKKYIPNVKIIYIVRNPAERAFSQYRQIRESSVRQNPKLNLDDLMKHFTAENLKTKKRLRPILSRGLYINHLNLIYSIFPKNNVYVMISERLKKDDNKEMNKLYKFLGVEEINLEVDSSNYKKYDKFKTKYSEFENSKSYTKWTTTKYKMSNKDRKILQDYYRGANKKLFELLGYEIKEW